MRGTKEHVTSDKCGATFDFVWAFPKIVDVTSDMTQASYQTLVYYPV